jgi:flavin-dependent dehydrogenase
VATLEGCPVTGLLIENGTICGVECGGRRITADVVVGADGFASIVSRSLGVYRHASNRWYVATRGYYRGVHLPKNTLEVHLLPETLPGFLWIFPTGDGVTNVGLGMVHRDIKKRGIHIRNLHESVVASPRFRDRFRGAERIGPISGWNLPTPDFSRPIHGGGFLLAGDAAGLVDPFSGEGIGNAILSGKTAALVAADAAERGDFSGTSLAGYPGALWQALNAGEIKNHYRLRSLARRRALVDFLIGRAANHRDVLDWITRMITDENALAIKRELVSPFTYLKLLFKSRPGRKTTS